jgi:uncharacterized OsmC-like protein
MGTHNEIDTTQVNGFTDLLREQPDLGAVTLRTRHDWGGGYRLVTGGSELEVAGQTIPRSPAVAADRPTVFGGTDTGPAPGELLLAALASCVVGQFAEQAALQGIDLDAVTITCEAHADVRGALDIDGVRPEMQRIDIRVTGTGADADTVTALLAAAVQTSPVAATLACAVPLSAVAEAAAPSTGGDGE